MRTFKAALFDLDGTLVDTEGQYTVFWRAMGKKYRPDVPDLAEVIKGTTLVQIFRSYFPREDWQAEITEALDRWEEQMQFPYVSGIEVFLADIRAKGVKCAIVTSSNAKKMKALEKKAPELLAHFDRILTSEDFAASKPAPDCYIRAAEALECQRTECVVFEDAFTGLQAGMSAEIFTIGLATGNTAAAIQDKCDYVLDNYDALTYDSIVSIINR